MARKKAISSFITKKGDVYNGIVDNNKLKITTQRTARGQHMLVGVFDIATKKWHNEGNLPKEVKRYFEDRFATPTMTNA